MNFEKLTFGSTRVPWPIVAAALAAMPFLAVAGLRSISSTPASAQAAPQEAASFRPVPPKPIPATSLALLSQFNAEASRGFGPSPMINRAPPTPPKPVVKQQAPKPVTPAPAPRSAEPPAIQVTSIMAAGNGQMMAVINGKLRRVGDSVGNGFKVVRIDKEKGEVAIRNREGVRAVFTLKSHEQDKD
jgi:hypothetical protein